MKRENRENITLSLLDPPLRFEGALELLSTLAELYLNQYTEKEIESATEGLTSYKSGTNDKQVIIATKADTKNSLTNSERKKNEILTNLLVGLANLKLLEDTLTRKDKVSAEIVAEISLTAAAQLLIATIDKKSIDRQQLYNLISPDRKGVKIYEGSQMGLQNRYLKKRRLYAEAEKIAEAKWKDGCTMKHHKMKEWLLNECIDEKGQLKFLDPDISEKALGEKLKKVLYRIGKAEDLIHGLSKK